MVTAKISFKSSGLRNQRGAVLILSAIFLVILTLMVLSIMRNGVLEERMASNARNRQLALQASEAMLRDVKSVFTAVPFTPFDIKAFTTDCANGYCKSGSAPSWADESKTRTFKSASTKLSGVSAQPRYYIEHIHNEPPMAGKKCPTVLFRITVRGEGRDASEVFLQGIYRHLPTSFAGNLCG